MKFLLPGGGHVWLAATVFLLTAFPARAGDAQAPVSVAPQASVPVAAEETTAPKVEMYPGTGVFTKGQSSGEPRTVVGEQGDITLNFVNTDVKDVAKAVLGDYLKLNYEIGANVQGTVTIQTSQPLRAPRCFRHSNRRCASTTWRS